MNKKFKQFLKTKRFWLSIFSALFLVFENILKHFGIDVNKEVYMLVVNFVLGIFVFLGILSYSEEDCKVQDKENCNLANKEEKEKDSENFLENNKKNYK